MFAPEVGQDPVDVPTASTRLCGRAAVAVRVPDAAARVCCGTVRRCEGMTDGARVMAQRTFEALRDRSGHEMGMSRATGRSAVHALQLLERATR